MSREVRQRVLRPYFTTKTEGGKPGTGLGLSHRLRHRPLPPRRGGGQLDARRRQPLRVLLPAGILTVHTGDSGPIPQMARCCWWRGAEPLLREAAAGALRSLRSTVHKAARGRGAAGAAPSLQARRAASTPCCWTSRCRSWAAAARPSMPCTGWNPTVRCVVCTGFRRTGRMQALRSAGAVGMLAKPYRIKDLQAALRRLAETLSRLSRRQRRSGSGRRCSGRRGALAGHHAGNRSGFPACTPSRTAALSSSAGRRRDGAADRQAGWSGTAA